MCATCKLERRIKISGLLLSAVFLLTMIFTTTLEMRAAAVFDEHKFFEFVQTMDQFHRKYIGCPPAGFPPAISCDKSVGTWDQDLWKKLQQKSKGLF